MVDRVLTVKDSLRWHRLFQKKDFKRSCTTKEVPVNLPRAKWTAPNEKLLEYM